MVGRISIARLCLALLLLAFSSTFLLTADDSSGPASENQFRHNVEDETFALVNEYRKANDLPLLKWSEAIAKEARGHSRDMASKDVSFGHDGFGDRVDRLKADMGGFQGAGENVLMTTDLDGVARKAVTLWLHSPHHLKNIRGDYNYSAIGVAQDKDGTIYFTQIFLKIGAATAQAADEDQTQVMTPFGMLASPKTR